MITDEMLQQAAAKAAEKLNASLPSASECHHQYSNQFERQIQKIVRRTQHPILYHTLRTAVCLLLMVAFSFSSVLIISVEARTTVFGWIKEVYESFYVYVFEDKVDTNIAITEYQLDWLPDGYNLVSEQETPVGKVAIYSDSTGETLSFAYANQSTDVTFLAEGVDYIQHHPDINGVNADVYLSPSQNESNAIVWIDDNTDTLLYITGYISEDELIRMAESVIVTNVIVQ